LHSAFTGTRWVDSPKNRMLVDWTPVFYWRCSPLNLRNGWIFEVPRSSPSTCPFPGSTGRVLLLSIPAGGQGRIRSAAPVLEPGARPTGRFKPAGLPDRYRIRTTASVNTFSMALLLNPVSGRNRSACFSLSRPAKLSRAPPPSLIWTTGATAAARRFPNREPSTIRSTAAVAARQRSPAMVGRVGLMHRLPAFHQPVTGATFSCGAPAIGP